MQRTWRHRIASGTGLAALLIAMLLAVIALDTFLGGWRLDLTERRLHTLSPASHALLAELEQDIELQLYFSATLAQGMPQLRHHARYVEDLLRGLVNASGGRLTLTVTDPLPFTDAEDEAAAAGLQAVPLSASGELLYFGLEASTRDARGETRSDTIRFFQPDREAFLEYEIMRLIHGLARDRRPVVGLVSGLPVTGGFDPGSQRPRPAWTSIGQLQQLFDVEVLDLDAEDTLDRVDLLLLIHPRELGEASRRAIDRYALAGGPILAFIDPHAEASAPAGMFPDAETDSDLPDILAAWGLRMLPDLALLDADRALVVSLGHGAPPLRHLAIAGFGPTDFAPDEVITAQLEQVNVATAGALEPLDGASTTFVPLIRSSRNAALVPVEQVRYVTDPRQLGRGFAPDGDSHVVAARVFGPARSAFTEAEGRGETNLEGHINVVVVADTDVLSDPLWVSTETFFGRRIPVPWASNGDLLVNAVDQLAGGSALVGLRGRAGFQRPFTRVETLQRQAEARFLETEQELERRLRETEDRLAELERQRRDAGVDTLTVEQLDALQMFQAEQLRIRRELRAVQRQLTEDIDRLGTRLKLLNTLAVPTLLVLAATLLALQRRRRRQAGLHSIDREA